MVASTDIKFYVHTNTNAPQLTNDYGCMIAVLDACLVTGFGSQTVSALTANDNIVTAAFNSVHNFMQYQVIEIAGATQAEYNGLHRILTVPSANSITFELAAVPSASTATGTITCKLPPLGWEKPFSVSSGAGKRAAYRSTNLLLPSRPFLRVVDELDPAYNASYAKYAKVGIVESMSDIDTMTGVQAPYDSANPTKNWVGTGSGISVISGWAKWYYARAGVLSNTNDTNAPTSGNRSYLIVGNKDYFYIFPCFTPDNGTDVGKSALPYGFGAFNRFYDFDNSNTFLNASIKDTIAALNISIGILQGITSNESAASTTVVTLLFRNFEQVNTFATARTVCATSGLVRSGNTNYINAASSLNQIVLLPCAFEETNAAFNTTSVKTYRGGIPGLYWLAQQTPLNDFQVFRKGSGIYIAKICTVGTSSAGQVVLKIGDL